MQISHQFEWRWFLEKSNRYEHKWVPTMLTSLFNADGRSFVNCMQVWRSWFGLERGAERTGVCRGDGERGSALRLPGVLLIWGGRGRKQSARCPWGSPGQSLSRRAQGRPGQEPALPAPAVWLLNYPDSSELGIQSGLHPSR